MQHVFIVGAKSLGAYGGYETFVNKLTEYHQDNRNIKYHIACKANGDGYMDEDLLKGFIKISDEEFEYHNAHCFKIKIPNIGAAQAIYYDIAALDYCCKYIKANKIQNAIVYVLACRIGPFMLWFSNKIHTLGGKIYINPDGHEWKRQKWSAPIRAYWKYSEKKMVKHADLIVCDSINIEKYIQESYKAFSPKTTFIAYGAETSMSERSVASDALIKWFKEKGIGAKEYYLIVGRFVPENNFETMIKEFMKTHTSKSLVIITTANEAFLEALEKKLAFRKDGRIKFVGTVYNQELLKEIRENAYAYIHGHEVGGTNPSLLEALGTTNLNLLLDVGFNREVALDTALYWEKEEGNLSNLISKCELIEKIEREQMGEKAKARIEKFYSWEYIAHKYESLFCN